MKVKCILKEGINGVGYEDMKHNEVRTVNKYVGEMLVNFGYVEEVKEVKK